MLIRSSIIRTDVHSYLGKGVEQPIGSLTSYQQRIPSLTFKDALLIVTTQPLTSLSQCNDCEWGKLPQLTYL